MILEGDNSLPCQKSKVNTAKDIINLTVAMSKFPLRRLAAYRHIIWCIEAEKNLHPLTAHIHLQWLHDVWGLQGDGVRLRRSCRQLGD